MDLAKKDFYPDFNVQDMWQRTDPSQFRAYYQFTARRPHSDLPKPSSTARTGPGRSLTRTAQKVNMKCNRSKPPCSFDSNFSLRKNQQSYSRFIAKA